MEKNYIEEVTNLKRATVEYVPKRLFDELEDMYRTYVMLGDFDSDTIDMSLSKVIEDAKANTIKLYQLDINDRTNASLKPPLNICPYCGEKMQLSYMNSVYGRAMNYVAYECLCCGAQSPMAAVSIQMLDEDIVAKEIHLAIERGIHQMKSEMEEEK